MTSLVSAVGCMRLFGGDPTSRPRAARHLHNLRLPPTTRESHHVPLARRNWFSLLPEAACQSFTLVIRGKPPNAAHHAPPHELAEDDNRRVGGRVHALVRFRPPLAHATPPGASGMSFNPRHASRYRLLPRSGRARRPPALSSYPFCYPLHLHNQKEKSYSSTGI